MNVHWFEYSDDTGITDKEGACLLRGRALLNTTQTVIVIRHTEPLDSPLHTAASVCIALACRYLDKRDIVLPPFVSAHSALRLDGPDRMHVTNPTYLGYVESDTPVKGGVYAAAMAAATAALNLAILRSAVCGNRVQFIVSVHDYVKISMQAAVSSLTGANPAKRRSTKRRGRARRQ